MLAPDSFDTNSQVVAPGGVATGWGTGVDAAGWATGAGAGAPPLIAATAA